MFLRSDCCSADAKHVATLDGKPLYFCGHHIAEHIEVLTALGYVVTSLDARAMEAGAKP
jgi:hypothetical protein